MTEKRGRLRKRSFRFSERERRELPLMKAFLATQRDPVGKPKPAASQGRSDGPGGSTVE